MVVHLGSTDGSPQKLLQNLFNNLVILSSNNSLLRPNNMSVTGIDAAAAKSLQSCPTLCDPVDGSPSGSPVPGILQARTLEWVAISFSSA